MSAPAISQPVDPTGLGGQRVVYNAKAAPYYIEVYTYPLSLSLEIIRLSWLRYYPRARHLTSVTQERVTAGYRLVKVERYDQPPKPRPHLDEPDV